MSFLTNSASQKRRWLSFLLPLLIAVPPGAWAQDQDEAPSRVGRVADVAGQLFVARQDRADEWAPSEINYPIGSGDNVWLSGDGRAEIDFGVAQFRIAGNTNAHVSRLDEHELSLFIAQGRAIVALRVLEGDSARIDTPNTQIELTRPGLYRIDVSDDRQQTSVVVREGEANVAVAGGFQQILPGQTAELVGGADVQVDIRNGSGLDGFDAWSAARDRYYARGRSVAYVSNQMVGYADLDQYGTWQTYPEYGAVWFPSAVAADWAPYRDGHWVSTPAWGFTWVDYAPWGYAPFHYGRWAYVGGRWGWCPGAYVRRPAWAPALVAWYGGSGWGVSAGGGPVYGWVPLGWRDPYIPAWRNCGSRCWSAYNRPYAVNVTGRPRYPTAYANHGVPGAITAVPGAALASGKPVAPNVVHVAPTMVATAPVLGAAPPVKPMPVGANTLRPGNGVPAPASAIARTKPLQVSPANAPSSAGRETFARPATPASPPAITAVPPARMAPPPVFRRDVAPPITAAPGASVQQAVPVAPRAPVQQAAPVAPRPSAQAVPLPRPSPPFAAVPHPVPQAAPVPVPQAAQAPAPPRVEHAPPHAVEKPAVVRPQPAVN